MNTSEISSDKSDKKVSLIVPFYNEGNTVFDFFNTLLPITDKIGTNKLLMLKYEFGFICIDDGSTDNTVKNLLSLQDKRIKLIEFSRNFKKEAALTAGINLATGDAIIPIDADLQDPPLLIAERYPTHQCRSFRRIPGPRLSRKQTTSNLLREKNV